MAMEGRMKTIYSTFRTCTAQVACLLTYMAYMARTFSEILLKLNIAILSE